MLIYYWINIEKLIYYKNRDSQDFHKGAKSSTHNLSRDHYFTLADWLIQRISWNKGPKDPEIYINMVLWWMHVQWLWFYGLILIFNETRNCLLHYPLATMCQHVHMLLWQMMRKLVLKISTPVSSKTRLYIQRFLWYGRNLWGVLRCCLWGSVTFALVTMLKMCIAPDPPFHHLVNGLLSAIFI